jgi:glycosyltransferase involved in cell wall biosynthesis
MDTRRDLPRIVLMTTAPEALAHFLSPHVRTLAAQGYDVHTISAPGLERFEARLESTHHEVPMRRTMRPLADLRSLFFLWRLLSRLRPGMLQTHTPKAGLLGMIAARLARVPVRIYTVNGLPIRVEGPVRALVLGFTERLACALATDVVCVSRSARRYIIGGRFCASRKCRVLGDGASHGVDTERFDPKRFSDTDRSSIRQRFGFSNHDLVLGYIGRIVPAKGINELAAAWIGLRERYPSLRLLLCGYRERDHPLDSALFAQLESDPRVHFTRDRVHDMPPIYAALDIAVLPTYCEGLPNVALEAAAMEVPIVATRVPGCVDAVRHAVTGLLVEPKNARALGLALQHLIEAAVDRRRMGRAARRFMCRRFSETRVLNHVSDLYRRLAVSVEADVTYPRVRNKIASASE